ncbi:hypothetical protein GTQ43_06280 [Nostoc sp. KVJ3]|nr:hypothetical protein [Nostoc sp. KVJ3]MCW5313428.1 hypothetical protein [Nostoc sp. KVJ3]
MKQSQRLGLLCFTLVRSQLNRKGEDYCALPWCDRNNKLFVNMSLRMQR